MARILIVEDERVVARDIREMLETLHHEVTGIAKSAETAVTLTRKTRPELILMDIRLQGSRDGIEAARTIGEITDIPIVFLTAYSDDELVDRAIQVMPFGYLLKPFQENELRFSIETALLKFEFEKKLKVTIDKYQKLFEQSNDPIFLHRITGEIVDVNHRACEMLGYTKTELLSMKLQDLQPRSERKYVRKALEETEKDGFIRFETQLKSESGNTVDVEISARIIDREKTLVQGIARNITERKSAEAKIREMNRQLEDRVKQRTKEIEQANLSLKKLSLAVEHGPAVVFITNVDGKIEYINSRFTGVLGYKPEEVIGKDPRMFTVTEKSEAEYNNLWRIVRTGEIWRGDLFNRHKDGTLIWLHTSFSPIKGENGALTHFVAVSEDITERRKIEAELKNYMKELEMFNKSMVDREIRIIELKEEVNSLLEKAGKETKYPPIWKKNNNKELKQDE
jgi:PAS domain S-box-containing protein